MGFWTTMARGQRYEIMARVTTAAFNPMMRSGLTAEPDRPISGTNMTKVMSMKYMCIIRGSSREDKWIINHFRSLGFLLAGLVSYILSRITRPRVGNRTQARGKKLDLNLKMVIVRVIPAQISFET